jgi:hypothetical protein
MTPPSPLIGERQDHRMFKALLFTTMTVLFIQSPAHATEKLQCASFAEKEAAKYAQMSLVDFHRELSLIWSCKSKANPNREDIQFGDASGLIGLSAEVVNGKCVLAGEIYSGQNDNDIDPEWDEENCVR